MAREPTVTHASGSIFSPRTPWRQSIRVPPATRLVEAAMLRARLSKWSTYPTNQPNVLHGAQLSPPRGPLPHMGTHPNTTPCRVHNVIPGRGMLYTMDTPTTPSADFKEALMGFRVGDKAAPWPLRVSKSPTSRSVHRPQYHDMDYIHNSHAHTPC